MSGKKILFPIPSIGIDYFAIIAIPFAFTLNRDGLNDTFIPKLRSIFSFELEVVNSCGEVHFTTKSLGNKGWNEHYKDQLVPEEILLTTSPYDTRWPTGQSYWWLNSNQID